MGGVRVVRIFAGGIDGDFGLCVAETDYRAGREMISLSGYLLLVDREERPLIAFNGARNQPCYLPANRVHWRLTAARSARQPICVASPRGDVAPVPAARFGPCVVDMPGWLAARLDQLTALNLRQVRAERMARRESKRREQARQSRRQHENLAARAKSGGRRASPEARQSDLFEQRQS